MARKRRLLANRRRSPTTALPSLLFDLGGEFGLLSYGFAVSIEVEDWDGDED